MAGSVKANFSGWHSGCTRSGNKKVWNVVHFNKRNSTTVQLRRGKSARFQLLKSCHNHQFLVKDDFSFSLDYFVKCAESLLLYNPVDFNLAL